MRNVPSVWVVQFDRRIFSAIQTLTVRPHPGRRWRLLQKTRCGRSVFRGGRLSSNPWRKPCRLSVPTVWQCGHGVSLSRPVTAARSCSSRETRRCSPPVGPASVVVWRVSGVARCGGVAGLENACGTEEPGSYVTQRCQNRHGAVAKIPARKQSQLPDGNSARLGPKSDLTEEKVFRVHRCRSGNPCDCERGVEVCVDR